MAMPRQKVFLIDPKVSLPSYTTAVVKDEYIA